MKKLVILSIALLFVVVGMAGMAQAASTSSGPGAAYVTLEGTVTVLDYAYLCKGATVETSEKDIFKTPSTKIKTNNKGFYRWADQPVSSLDPPSGDVTAKWSFNIFGITLEFEKDEEFDFGPDNLWPGKNSQTVDIEVEY
jgi:hypothetical protein